MPKSGATATSVLARALAWGKPRGARTADLSAAAAEQEDGPQDDTAGPQLPSPLRVEGVEVHPATATSIVDTCRQLDESLAAVFIRGDIRLLRSAWLLEAPDQHLPYRQVLEERERRGESPLLSPEEAAALLARGDRSIGALTHPWYSPGDPDPAGVKLKILREALLVLTHIEAIFVDYASLLQHPPKGTRTEAENEAFKRALGVMGDVYASAVGTTVLQIKDIPPRPHEFDGELCLFGLKDWVDEEAVRQALSGDLSTEFESCDLAFESSYGIVRFTTHAAALQAMAANAFSGLCGGVDTRYNERLYDDRGWCCFEGGVSGELLVRLSVYPRMKAELSKLPPKLLSLASGRAPEPVELSRSDVWQRVQQVIETIEQATFTGKGDKEVVPKLYKSYVERVATVLTSTLALQTTLDTAAEVPPMPLVDAPPTDALRLADGQLLLLLPGADARLAGGDGAWLAEVDASGRAARPLFGGDEAELTFDGHSHAVIPWRPAEAGASLRDDLPALQALGERVQSLLQSLRDAASHPPSEAQLREQLREQPCQHVVAWRAKQLREQLRELGKASVDVVADAVKLPTVATVAGQAGDAIRNVLKKDAAEADEGAASEGPAPVFELRLPKASLGERLHKSLELLSPTALNTLAVAAWREGGLVGARRFASGQRLVVRGTDGAWREAAAEEACTLGGGPASLHPWNHAPLEVSLDAFEALRAWHTTALRAQHSHIVDALSGRRLDALEQCVAIEVAGGGAELASVADARSLAAWLRTLHEERLAGGEATRPPATLLTAGPASGKTTLLSQLVALSLDSELVPILIKVQFLQQRLISSPDAFATAWNWVDAYLRLEHGEASPVYRMLRQAMTARRALLLLDGLDEGGTNRDLIERHVTEVLAPQGHVLLATSRPAAIDEDRFATFHRLRLSPLTPEQQEQALVQRLGHGRSALLLDYVRERVPVDTETGLRVTANPLMLSMFASVFELRTGLPMPSTVAELYKVASDVMLSRSGAASLELRRLLQAIFFEAQVSQGRVIEDRQLDEAALGLERPEALKAIRERARAQRHLDGNLLSLGLDETAYLRRAMAGCAAEVRSACDSLPAAMRDALAEMRSRVARDELPLLSLLQVEPLQLQSSHLSFQEYFAARALCEEGTLSGAPPWKWQASWANTLALGAGMGEPFAKGLKRAAGVEGDSLNLCGQLGGDRPTALRAVGMLSAVLKTLNLESNNIGVEGAIAIGEALKVNEVLTELPLGQNYIGPEGVKAIADALRVNGVLTSLDVGGNSLTEEAALGIVRIERQRNKLTSLGLAGCAIGPTGAAEIAEYVSCSGVLTNLNLGQNYIGPEGVKAIGEALAVNGVLTSLDVGGNSLTEEAALGIVRVERQRNKLTSLGLARCDISPTGAAEIAEYVSDHGVLKTLYIGYNHIGPKGAAAIAEALRDNVALTDLQLHHNEIGDEGAAALGEALKVNEVLTDLDLYRNNIGDEGVKAIGGALAVNEVLTYLELGANMIGPIGAIAIADALRVNGVLTKLILDSYELDLPKLRGTDSVTSLDLSRKNLGTASAIVIASLVTGNKVLTKLNLDGHELDLPKLRGTDPVESLDLSSKDLGPASAIEIASLNAARSAPVELRLPKAEGPRMEAATPDKDDDGIDEISDRSARLCSQMRPTFPPPRRSWMAARRTATLDNKPSDDDGIDESGQTQPRRASMCRASSFIQPMPEQRSSAPHRLARDNDRYYLTERFPLAAVRRSHVDDEHVPWAQPFPGYAPGGSGFEFAPGSRAGLNLNPGKGLNEQQVLAAGLNPGGRTGLTGGWDKFTVAGANYAVDPIITRFKPGSDRRRLQLLAVLHKDGEEWAIPGARLRALPGGGWERDIDAMERGLREKGVDIVDLDEGGKPVFRGYVDDARNTDDAWIETTVRHFHLNDLGKGEIQSPGVRWVNISPEVPIYQPHCAWVYHVADEMLKVPQIERQMRGLSLKLVFRPEAALGSDRETLQLIWEAATPRRRGAGTAGLTPSSDDAAAVSSSPAPLAFELRLPKAEGPRMEAEAATPRGGSLPVKATPRSRESVSGEV